MSSEIPPNIQVSAGPLLLGYVFNWGLYGALSVQVYMYYMAFPNDRRAIKTLVFGLYALETVQTILITHDLFHGYAIGWGNLAQLSSAQLEWLATPIFSGIVSCIVQMFFAYRISILSGSKIVGCIISLIAITQCASAITQGIQAAVIGDFARLQTKAFVSCTLWLTGSAVCDVIIAIAMSYYLSRKDSAFKSTQIMINKLVRLTIETGSLTATVATIDIILFLAFPHNNYHTTPALTLAKLYSNTLVLIFNSRMRVVGGRDGSQTTELLELRTTALNSATLGGSAPAIRVNPGQNIKIHQDTWTDRSGVSVDKSKHGANWTNV